MSEEFAPRLHRVTVVLTAQYYDPSLLSHSFLVASGIVPEDWEIDEEGEKFAPALVVSVHFRNGVEWTLSPTKLSVGEACEGSFQEEYRVHDLAQGYLRTLPSLHYGNLGLNWNVSMKCKQPEIWLTERFLKDGNWLSGRSNLVSMRPRLTFQVDEALCNFDFSDGHVERDDGHRERVVIVDCNVHHPESLDARQLRDAIAQWKSRQSFVLSALHELLEATRYEDA